MLKTNLAYVLTDARHYEEALQVSEKITQDYPVYSAQRRNYFLHELRASEPERATRTYKDFVVTIGGDPLAAEEIGALWVAWLRNGESGTLTEDLIRRAQLGSEDLAQVLAAMGDAEGTIQALQEAIPEHSGSRSVFSMKINPLYDFIRDDPRFQVMLVKIGLGATNK